MNKNIMKRLFTYSLTMALFLTSSVSAFAAEETAVTFKGVPESAEEIVTESTIKVEDVSIDEISEDLLSARAVGTGASGYCSAKGRLTLYPTLNSYVGVSRYFWFWASANDIDTTPSGVVHVTVKNPDGTVLDSFAIGANTDYIKKFTLPSSGQYTVEITSGINTRLYCNAAWSTKSQ